MANPDELDVLTETEAMNFFRSRFGRDFSKEESAELANLAEELGHFPLALEQAAAYLRATKTPVAKYLADLKARGLPVLEKGKVTATDYKETVATTWEAAFEIIERDHPVSAEVLRLSAFLAPDKIPIEFFDSYKTFEEWKKPVRSFFKKLFQRQSSLTSNSKGNDLIVPLTHFSLVKIHAESQSFNIHRLVQEVTKSRLVENSKRQLIERIINLICGKFPKVKFENWPTCTRLLPHALATSMFMREFGIENAQSASLLNQTGSFLNENARYEEARILLEQALEIRKRKFGARHPFTAQSLNNLAELYRLQGCFTQAEPLYQQALWIYEGALGKKHPDTARLLNNLALVYFLQGRYAEAEPLYERALRIYEGTLGAEHYDTARSLSNLGLLYYSQGRYAEAEQLYERALNIFQKVLGDEHPNTKTVEGNLAALRRKMNSEDTSE